MRARRRLFHGTSGKAMNQDHDALLRVTDSGLYCERGGFYIDPWRPVGPRDRHARARRPPRVGMRRVPGRARRAGRRPGAAGRAGDDRDGPLRRIDGHQRRDGLAPPRRAHPGLGPGAGRARRPGLGRLGRLQGRARRRPVPRSSRSAAIGSSASAPSGCRSTDGVPSARSWRGSPRGGGPTATRAGRASCMPIRSARRSGRSPGWRRSSAMNSPARSTPTAPSRR